MRQVPLVQIFEVVVVNFVDPHRLQQPKKMPRFLAINFAEFEHFQLKIRLTENFCRKKIRRFVVVLKIGGLNGVARHHRRQLEQVAKKHHLYTAKRAEILTIHAQKLVYAVEHIGAHHRDFVNDEHFEIFVHPQQVFARHFLTRLGGRDDAWRKSEKRVNRLPLHVERGHAGRGKHGAFFLRGVAEKLEQGAFAGACFARDEKTGRCFFQRIEGVFEIVVELERQLVEHDGAKMRKVAVLPNPVHPIRLH